MREPGGKRDLIGTEALRLFVEHGVDAVSVRDIAAACDMKASNLYAHFASKDALVAGLFHEGYAEYGALLAETAAGPRPVPPPPGPPGPRHLPPARRTQPGRGDLPRRHRRDGGR
jgi:AcrR family transcriptional regulator